MIYTGATDPICNDVNRFVSFDSKSKRTTIKTGAGNVAVNATGTVILNILRSDGSINNVTLSDVLYAPGMPVSIVSHSKMRAKGYYYHGRTEKIMTTDDKRETAYAPEINGVPNVLLATNKTSNSTKPNRLDGNNVTSTNNKRSQAGGNNKRSQARGDNNNNNRSNPR